MGWIYQDLARAGLTLEQAKRRHVAAATDYGPGTTARIIMHEWHARSWYAIIGLYAVHADQRSQKPHTIFLRTDRIDTSEGQFGYKAMTERMGPLPDDRPSRAMAKAIFTYIPDAEGDAIPFRRWCGIPFFDKTTVAAAGGEAS